jgi:hypothetical protein
MYHYLLMIIWKNLVNPVPMKILSSTPYFHTFLKSLFRFSTLSHTFNESLLYWIPGSRQIFLRLTAEDKL